MTKQVTISGVPPGESKTATVTATVEYAGTYTASLRGTDASAEFSVSSREVPLGEAAPLGDDLALTVDSAGIESAVIAEGPGPQYLDPPVSAIVPADDPAGTMLLAVEATVENTGDAPHTFDPSALPVSAESGSTPSFYTDMGREVADGVPLSGVASLDGDPLAGRDIPPGESRSGWLLAPVSRETVAVRRGPSGAS